MQFSDSDGEHWYSDLCTGGHCTVYYSNTMGILPYICGSKYVISTCIRRPSMVDMWVKGLMGIYNKSTNFHHRLYIQIYTPHKTHKRAILEKEKVHENIKEAYIISSDRKKISVYKRKKQS